MQKIVTTKFPEDEITELDLQQLGNPLIGKFYRPKKELISIRLDADVLHWFKTYPQYQTLINRVCRSYMLQILGK